MGIEDWSTTAADNNAAAPNGWPEGMAPSDVNDSARQMMADVRAWYEGAEWIDLGATTTYAATDQFTIGAGTDLTGTWYPGRRVRAVGSLTGTIYGVIGTSAYANPTTTVTVTWDSGELSNDSDLVVSHGILNPANPSTDYDALSQRGKPLEYVGKNSGAGGSYAFTDLEAGYDYYFFGREVVPDAEDLMGARLSTDNGSTYAGTADTYEYAQHFASASSGVTGGGGGTDDQMRVGAYNVDTVASGGGLNFEAVLFNPVDATQFTRLMSQASVENASNLCTISNVGCTRSVAEANDAIEFSFYGNNIASGTIECWRRKRQ